MKPTKPTQLLLKGFDPELHAALRIEAAHAGKTIKAWAMNALREAVRKAREKRGT
jgi:predicted HicB family RNase H-like nuclease